MRSCRKIRLLCEKKTALRAIYSKAPSRQVGYGSFMLCNKQIRKANTSRADLQIKSTLEYFYQDECKQ